MPSAQTKKLKVGIIGAGFGGISTALNLCDYSRFDIEIIDRRNHHLFQPLLYQVAMAGLNPSEIAVPIRKLFSRQSNITVTLAEVEDVDIGNRSVFFDDQWKTYDYLVLACGAKHFYFGNNDWETIAPGLKTIEQATEIRRRILTAFEMAEKQTDENLKQAYLTFVVVGGGPTGVELAGSIAEMARMTLKNDYKRADLSQTKVHLVESGDRVLAAFPQKLSERAERDLLSMGVIVQTQSRASELTAEGLKVGEHWVDCRTIIWAAGVRPSQLAEKSSCPLDPQGRLIVKSDLSIEGHPNVFCIGDMAHSENKNGQSLPGIAPVAIQQGQFLAKLIANESVGTPRKKFSYWDKGIMATIGRSRAVVSSGKMQLTGFPAWLVWVVIHILYLMCFKNRFFVFLQWTWAYFKFGQGARLIVQKTWRFYGGKNINYESKE